MILLLKNLEDTEFVVEIIVSLKPKLMTKTMISKLQEKPKLNRLPVKTKK